MGFASGCVPRAEELSLSAEGGREERGLRSPSIESKCVSKKLSRSGHFSKKHKAFNLLSPGNKRVFESKWVKILCFQNPGIKKTRFIPVVSRKTVPKAVQRNQLKRWLREIFRHHRERFPSPADILFIVRDYGEEVNFRVLKDGILELFQ